MIVRILMLAAALLITPTMAAETWGQSANTATLFARHFPLTRGILVADFPRDLTRLEASFGDIDSTEISPEIKMQRAFLGLTALRKTYAPQLKFARTELSALMALSLAAFYETVLRREGPKVCGGFAADGAATLFTLGVGATYVKEMDRQAAAYFSAVASALENPDVLGPASAEDWSLVMSQIVIDGKPTSYVASIAAARPDDPNLCPALAAFFHAMIEVKSDAGQRVRAEFIQGATGY